MTASTSWDFSDRASRLLPPLDTESAVLLGNLSEISEGEAALMRRRTAQLEELAALLTLPEYAPIRDLLPDIVNTLAVPDGAQSHSQDLALLCRALIRLGYRYSDEIFQKPEEASSKSAERVAYLQNHFTDEAFFKLTGHLKKARAAYFSSIADVCEEVYHGLCEFCILPIESSEDGKLLRFYALIEKFDLKIVAICDLENADGAYTRYALLRHRFVSLHPITESDQHFAEFNVVMNAEITLTDILRAAEMLDLRLVRADALPLPYRTDVYRYGLVFSLNGAAHDSDAALSPSESLEAFLLYLSLTASEWSSLGFYSKVSE